MVTSIFSPLSEGSRAAEVRSAAAGSWGILPLFTPGIPKYVRSKHDGYGVGYNPYALLIVIESLAHMSRACRAKTAKGMHGYCGRYGLFSFA